MRVPRQDGLPRLAALGDAYCLEVAPSDLNMLVFDDLAERDGVRWVTVTPWPRYGC